MACIVAPLTSGVPVAVIVWITPGASTPGLRELVDLGRVGGHRRHVLAAHARHVRAQSPAAGTPACCCIAVACAMASAALCLRLLGLVEESHGTASSSGEYTESVTDCDARPERASSKHEPVGCDQRRAQLSRCTRPSTRRPSVRHTSGSRPSAPSSASPAFTAWSRATPSASSTAVEPVGEGAERERAGGVELLGVERTAEQVAQLARLAQHVDDGQRVDALEQVLTRVLAERVVGRREIEHVVDDLEAHAEMTAEAGERVEGRRRRRPTPCRRCGTTSRTAPRSCPRSRRSSPPRSGRRRRGAAARAPVPGTAHRWWRRAATRRRRRATPRATTPGRGGSRRRGWRRCCSSARSRWARRARVSASSITSSW